MPYEIFPKDTYYQIHCFQFSQDTFIRFADSVLFNIYQLGRYCTNPPPIYCMNLKHNMDITFTKIRIIQIISIFSKKCLNLFNSQAFFTITIIFPQIIMFCNIFLF